MLVKEAFSRAFGEVPAGATCHAFVQIYANGIQHDWVIPSHSDSGSVELWEVTHGWYYHPTARVYDSPDISNRPAENFRDFFGDAYDRVLDEEQNSPPNHRTNSDSKEPSRPRIKLEL